MLSPIILVTFAASVLLCGIYRYLALRWQIIDVPNSRSAHTEPTPRGGGVGLFLALVVGAVLGARVLGQELGVWADFYTLLLVLGGVCVLIGSVDDLVGLPVALRFIVYSCLSVAAVFYLWWPVSPWILGLAVLYLLWLLNLYNFMDGTDGLAALECLFVCLSAAALGSVSGVAVGQILFCLLLAAASAGFLVWNWPPARLFMGDAGSITLGFMLGLLSLMGATAAGLPLVCWLILLAVFITDSSATLLWRLLTGQAVTHAHSQHLYQRLSRNWTSHERVLWALMAVNLLWLLPLATVAVLRPGWAWYALLVAYLPLLAGMAKTGKLP